jgi:hypothetical protein
VPLNIELQLKLKLEGVQLSIGPSGKEASVGSSDLALGSGRNGTDVTKVLRLCLVGQREWLETDSQKMQKSRLWLKGRINEAE